MKSTVLALAISFPFLTACDSSPKAAADVAKEATSTASPAPPSPVEKPGIIGSSWLVEDIEAKGVIDNARTFIRFDSAEKVSGSGGVNRFNGPCTLSGDKLSFGVLVTTRMAGPPAVMKQESAFFTALAKVRSFKLDENGLLHFHDAEGNEVVRMSRTDNN